MYISVHVLATVVAVAWGVPKCRDMAAFVYELKAVFEA